MAQHRAWALALAQLFKCRDKEWTGVAQALPGFLHKEATRQRDGSTGWMRISFIDMSSNIRPFSIMAAWRDCKMRHCSVLWFPQGMCVLCIELVHLARERLQIQQGEASFCSRNQAY